MKKGQFTFIGLLLTLVLAFTACSPKAVAPTPAAAVPVPQAQARQAWEVEWEKLMANARKEGKVVIYATSIGDTLRASYVLATKEKFGLDAEFMVGIGAEVSRKLISERQAGLYRGDVYLGGSSTAVNVLNPAGALQPLGDVILLPEALDSNVWYGGSLRFVDRDHKILALLAYPGTSIAINTNLVKPEEIKSYRNLLEPRWKGKMTLNDPTVAGTGGKWFTVFGVGVEGKPIWGLDFMRELVRQEPLILRDQRLQIEWLAQGKYTIALAPLSASVAEFIAAGASIQLVTTEEGTYLTAGAGNVSLLDKAPHPNAARVFINWILTREAQTLFSQTNDAQSGRLDVPTDRLSPTKVRDPKAKYIWGDEEDFLIKEPEYMKISREIFAPLLK